MAGRTLRSRAHARPTLGAGSGIKPARRTSACRAWSRGSCESTTRMTWRATEVPPMRVTRGHYGRTSAGIVPARSYVSSLTQDAVREAQHALLEGDELLGRQPAGPPLPARSRSRQLAASLQ